MLKRKTQHSKSLPAREHGLLLLSWASCKFSMTCSASAGISNVCDLQISFILPTVYPVTYANLNWTCAMVGVVIIGVLGAWFAPTIGARHWYTGKSHTLESRHDVVSTHCMHNLHTAVLVSTPFNIPISAKSQMCHGADCSDCT